MENYRPTTTPAAHRIRLQPLARAMIFQRRLSLRACYVALRAYRAALRARGIAVVAPVALGPGVHGGVHQGIGESLVKPYSNDLV